jgi:hypothetical protein
MRALIEHTSARASSPPPSVVAAVVHRAALLMDATVAGHLVDDYVNGGGDGDGARPAVDGRVCGFKMGTWAAACFWVAQKVEFSDMDDDVGVVDIERRMNAYDGLVAAESALLALLDWEVIVPTAVDIGVLLFERRASLASDSAGDDDETRRHWAHRRQDAVEACAQLLLDAVPLTPPMFSSAAVAAVAFAAATVGQVSLPSAVRRCVTSTANSVPAGAVSHTGTPEEDAKEGDDSEGGKRVSTASRVDGAWYPDSSIVTALTVVTVNCSNKRLRVM